MVSVWKKKMESYAHSSFESRYDLFSLAFTLTYYQFFSFIIYKITFPRFVILSISKNMYWLLIFYGSCLIFRGGYSIPLQNVVGLLSPWNLNIQI